MEDTDLEYFWNFFPFIYRINDSPTSVSNSPPTILDEVCKERGWKEYELDNESIIGQVLGKRIYGQQLMGWNLWWRITPIKLNPYKTLYSWQFTNHIPRANRVCNKETLMKQLRIMKNQYGQICDFIPMAFALPSEYNELELEHERRKKLKSIENARNLMSKQESESETLFKMKSVWIFKPLGKSQGKGIFIVDDVKQLYFFTNAIAQEYISRPFLIGGFKFDLRIYVTIVSIHPLTIYAYREGIVRFATEKYNLKNLNNVFSHLTNASLNKFAPDYKKDKESVGLGCKWSFQQLRNYFKKIGVDDFLMWQKIISIIKITLIGQMKESKYSPYNKNCFEFLGFDILIDSQLRPWLLEVNSSPGLGSHCEIDDNVKRPMLHELFDLLGLPFKLKQIERSKSKPKARTKKKGEKSKGISSSSSRKLNPSSSSNPSSSKLSEDEKKRLKLMTSDQVEIILELSKIQSCKNLFEMSKTKIEEKISCCNNNKKYKVSPLSHSFSGRGILKNNNWNEAPKNKGNVGNWTLIFPFDKESCEISREKININEEVMIKRIFNYLKRCKELSSIYKGQSKSDQFYIDEINKSLPSLQEIWIPPN